MPPLFCYPLEWGDSAPKDAAEDGEAVFIHPRAHPSEPAAVTRRSPSQTAPGARSPPAPGPSQHGHPPRSLTLRREPPGALPAAGRTPGVPAGLSPGSEGPRWGTGRCGGSMM